MAGLKRIFGENGMVPQGGWQEGLVRTIDSEAQRIAVMFKDCMPSDVQSLFASCLAMHLSTGAANRQYQLSRLAKQKRRPATKKR